jgi:hypothetical protein
MLRLARNAVQEVNPDIASCVKKEQRGLNSKMIAMIGVLIKMNATVDDFVNIDSP